MDVLLTGNHDLLVWPQAAPEFDLVADQIANLNPAREDPLPGAVVDVDQREGREDRRTTATAGTVSTSIMAES